MTMHLRRRHKMMEKVAVLMAEGYEEGETLTIVDILRRAGIQCNTFAVETWQTKAKEEMEDNKTDISNGRFVKGMHGMMVKADNDFSDEVKDYDMLVLPGGRPGGANLKENPEVIQMVKYFAAEGKFVAAMCSGTLVLAEADVIKGKQVTGYTGYAEKLPGAVFKEDVVVADGKLVTSQGPATVYPFAYKLAEVLGKDVSLLKERMLYNFAGGR